MIGWERIQAEWGKANLKRWVLSFERNVETNNELRVSGGREFQSLGAMTEKALLPRDVRTYGMDRTDESDDLVDRVRRKRKTIVKIGRLMNLKRFICEKAQFVILLLLLFNETDVHRYILHPCRIFAHANMSELHRSHIH